MDNHRALHRTGTRAVWAAACVVCVVGAASAVATLRGGSGAGGDLGTEGDDLNSLILAYSQALRALDADRPDQQTRQHFYRHWLTTLLDECEQLPPDQIPESIRLTCLSLANGARDYELAEALAAQGAADAPELRSRVTYWDQRVAIREAVANQSGSGIDRALVRQVADEALAALRPTLGEAIYANDPVALLSVRRLFDVAARAARADGDPRASLSLFEEAAAFVRPMPADTLQQIGKLWWGDQLLQEAAADRIAMGDIPGAIRTLREIDSLGTRRASSSEHALLCAGPVTPLGSFRTDFARAWLAQDIPWTGADIHLAYSLAFDLVSGGDSWPTQAMLDEAVGYLETILAMDAQLEDADDAASRGEPSERWAREPVRSSALVTLALAYEKLGQPDEAADVAGIVLSEYPAHPSVGLMESLLE